MDKGKLKTSHSMFSNIFYFIKLLFKISPGFVIGELFDSVIRSLPSRLISVIGAKWVIDIIANGEDKRKIILAIGVIALILILSQLIFAVYQEFYWNVAKEKTQSQLSRKLYEKARELDLESYDNPQYYNTLLLTIEASAGGFIGTLDVVKRYFGELVTLLTISSIILAIDPICLLIILAFVIVFTPLSNKIGRVQALRQIDNNKYHRRADYFARIFYLQDYAKEVRMNGIKPLLIERYNDAADDVIDNQRRYVKKIDFYYFIQENGVQIFGFMLALPLYLGYCVLVKKTLSPGDFVATFNGAYAVATSFSFITVFVARTFSEKSRLIEKYREFLNTTAKMQDGDIEDIEEKPKEIVIKNMSFTYPGNDQPTLNDINLTIKPYEKIALVGYNGAGKTTLTNLLLRLYDVSEGSIEIDGVDIRNMKINSHRNRFSAVFQDFQIFAASVGENVSLDTSYDGENVNTSLEKSGFSKQLKNGIKTQVLREFDDNGLMMSGGEGQKLAIARAFYKNCPYIILDEPSANLDPVAEYKLNQTMLAAAEHKTVIFISHRLSTTVNADKIYVMEQGRIIESGTHSELMAIGGVYNKMFTLQAEKYSKSNL